MAAYVIFDLRPSNREALKPYLDRAWDTIATYGGKAIVRGGEIEVRETWAEKPWHPARLLIIELPDLDQARAWYDSPEYQAILPIRLNAQGPGNMIIADGI